MAADLDGILIRVFYDFRGDLSKNGTSRKVPEELATHLGVFKNGYGVTRS